MAFLKALFVWVDTFPSSIYIREDLTLFPLLLASRLLDRRSQTASDAAEFDRRVRFNPIVNRIFDRVMRIDEALIRRRWSLPCGGSLLVVARRP